MSPRRLVYAFFLSILCAAANAESIVQQREINWTLDSMGGPATFALDPFDSMNGTRQLTDIKLAFQGELDLEFEVQNLSTLELAANDWYIDGGANIIVSFAEKPGYEDGGPFYGLGGVYRAGVTGRLSPGSGEPFFLNPTPGDVTVTATVGGIIDSVVSTDASSFGYFIADEPLQVLTSPFLDFVITPPLEDPSALINAEAVQLTQIGMFTMTYEYVLALGRPEDCNGDGAIDMNDLNCVCNEPNAQLQDVLAAIGLRQGDIDGDGLVGFADFLTLSTNFGEPGDYTDGDLDCSGQVDFPDFLILADNFPTAEEAATSVPEPNGNQLLFLGLLLGLSGRQTKRAGSMRTR